MTKDIQKKNKSELENLYAENVVLLRNFRFGMAHSKSRNLKEGRNLRKEIARIKTELKKRDN